MEQVIDSINYYLVKTTFEAYKLKNKNWIKIPFKIQ